MICPKCDEKGLVAKGSREKEEYRDDYYTCPKCKYVFIVRKNNKPYSETDIKL